MKKKLINIDLKGIPETLLIPLRARYLESNRKNGIIQDFKTIEILDALQYDFSSKKEVSKGSQIGTAIRTEILDEQTKKFLTTNPNSIVVNLGCGLDTRFHRLDNGLVEWFDLDISEVISLRSHFFKETKRYQFIALSAFDFLWMVLIPKGKPTLIIAEGLLMYFSEKEVKLLLQKISKSFPNAEFLIEAMSPYMAKHTNSHPDVKSTDAQFEWGINSGKELEAWDLGLQFKNEWFYFDRHRDRWPLIFRLLTLIPAFRKSMKIIQLKIGHSISH